MSDHQDFVCEESDCELGEDEINSYDDDKYKEICDLLKKHGLEQDDADDVAEAQGLLRQHILARERAKGDGGQHSAAKYLSTDVISSLVKDHHKRRKILLKAADKVQQFITELPKHRKKELKRYFPDLEDDMSNTISDLQNEKCIFIIAGESGSGKSCLINLLMGQLEQNFLPVSNLPSTSCMCDISYGDPGKITAYPAETEDVPVMRELTTDNVSEGLSEFTHQKVDRENIKYNRVEVKWPCEWLKGINLVDSPGVGENEEMTNLVKKMMPEAVGFIYVINTQKAGGIQPGDLEDLLFDHIKHQEGKSLPGQVFDPSTAMFVFNKWDCINQSEKDKVKNYVCNKLKQVWKGLDLNSQIFFLSAQQATDSLKKQGFVTDEYRKVLCGIERLMDMSLRSKMKRHYGYLTAVLERCKFILLMYLNSYPNLREEYEEAKARMESLSSKSYTVKKQLKETFKNQAETIVVKMKEHLSDPVTQEQLCTWHETECPNKKDLKRAVKVMARLRVYENIKKWEEENEIYAKAQQKMMEVFQREFVALSSDLSTIEGTLLKGDDTNIRQWLRNIGISAHDSELLKLAKKIALGVTLGILTGFVGLTGWGIYEASRAIGRYIQKKREEGKHFSTYQNNEIDMVELMKRETKTVIESICEGTTLQSAIEETLGGLVVSLNAMLKKIPQCIEADRALLSDMQKQLEEGLDETTRRQCNGLLEKVVQLQHILDFCSLIYIQKADIHCDDLTIDWSEKLGGGTFGDVYRGVLKKGTEDLTVAVKTLKAGLSHVNATEVRTEIQFLKNIECDNMVHYYGMCMMTEVHSDDPNTTINIPCMVIEKCDTSLDHVIYDSRKYTGPGVCLDHGVVYERATIRMAKYATEIASGIAAMHKYNLAHRDIKPGNILVKLVDGPDGLSETLKLCDFGMSKSEEYITHSDVGTVLYMAPEVIDKKHYGKEADIFSYGIILIELYYGKLAHRLGFVRCDFRPTTFLGNPLSVNSPSQDWIDFITKCYSHNPEDRPTAEECKDFFKNTDILCCYERTE